MEDRDSDYRSAVQAQQNEVLDYLARLGLALDFDVEVPEPEEGSPLAETMMALRLVAENLRLVSKQRDEALRSVEEKLEVISSQAQAIQELSTPAIEVWEDVLVLPLIGAIDTARAAQIMDGLLEATVSKRARFVIIDITGVPVVDTRVADHFLRTIEAVRIVGARAILTGVSPHNAQTLVRLGVDLSRIETRGTLRAALAHVLNRMGTRVVRGTHSDAGWAESNEGRRRV